MSALDSRLGLVLIGGGGTDVKFTNTLFQDNDYNVPGIVSLVHLFKN